ncbi:hypothetical protein [Spongiibacter marinus]|uniref:hypothetical protein n=1 Tax=Spongiibacter marinus TaxID=354246 RepID=UPI0035616AE2
MTHPFLAIVNDASALYVAHKIARNVYPRRIYPATTTALPTVRLGCTALFRTDKLHLIPNGAITAMNPHTPPPTSSEDTGQRPCERRFQFSSNRGNATHRVRYVESGGGNADQACRLCQPTLPAKSR